MNTSEYKQLISDLCKKYPAFTDEWLILIAVEQQILYLYQPINGFMQLISCYPVSTASAGIGNQEGSGKTPLGAHTIKQRFGEGETLGMVFKGRRSTGKIARIETDPKPTQDDCITSRILWLSGLEEGINSGTGIDSYQRYIYIHGTDEEGFIGKPASKGCIRMKNQDVIELFDKTTINALVYII